MRTRRIFLFVLNSIVITSCSAFNFPNESSNVAYDSLSQVDSNQSSILLEIPMYTITWKNYDGTILKIDQSVQEGTLPIYNDQTPVREKGAYVSFFFSGWEPTVGLATKDTTYTAVFTRKSNDVIITWKNYDGTVLETDSNVNYGTIPVYNNDPPTKASDGMYTYHFDGWTPTVESATSSVTYTAIFIRGKQRTFGIYPQTKVTDSSLISKLNSKIGAWTSYNYYINGSNDVDFMRYQDVNLDDNLYRAVFFSSYRPYSTLLPGANGDNSYQDDNGYNINTCYWFKFEPILWDVLEDDDELGSLLLSRNVIDSQEFFHLQSTFLSYKINGQPFYPNSYKDSNVRKWLNDNFLSLAFSPLERELIKITNVDNSPYSTGEEKNIYTTVNSYDKVFLPSYRDYELTINSENYVSQEMIATDYAKALGVDIYQGYPGWWLRSPYCPSYTNSHTINDVMYGRTYVNFSPINYKISILSCPAYYSSGGILPALRIQS